MAPEILITSTSFLDCEGLHKEKLLSKKLKITNIRGPLKQETLFEVIDKFDALICGDDEITYKVLEKGFKGKLRIISKYGSGLDKIDLDAAKKFNIIVTSCPGINQTSVAEHVFALILSFCKNIIDESIIVQNKQWERLIGIDLNKKIIGVIGTGNVGKEVIKRALAFGMNVVAFDKFPDKEFEKTVGIKYYSNLKELIALCDFISLNIPLTSETRQILNLQNLGDFKKGVILVNTARAGLVEKRLIIEGIEKGIIGGYLTDVLDDEPIKYDDSFLGNSKILITPHIASRTYENIVNQGLMAVENLFKYL